MFTWTPKISKWSNDLKDWEKLNKNTKSLLLSILNKDPEFSNYYSLFLKWPKLSVIVKSLTEKKKSISPFIFIANSDSSFYEKYVTNSVLKILAENFSSINRTYQGMFYETLINHISRQTSNDRIEQIHNFFKNNSDEQTYSKLLSIGIIRENGYQKLLSYCNQNNYTELDLSEICGLQVYNYQALYKSLEIDLFLEKLKTLDYSKPNKITRYIINNDLFNKEVGNGLLLGHKIISSVIKYSKTVDIHASWLELILSIASDPRSSSLSQKYLKWWSPISVDEQKRFIQILSHADILLFLDAFELFAKNEDRNMARMFKSRKQFLTGLSYQKLISDTRLFLPTSVKNFIKNERPNLDTSYIAETYGNSNTCIIYLKVGPYHIIEGSHNCQIWVYDDNPFPYDITDKNNYSRSYRELTMGLAEEYYSSFLKEPFHTAHYYQGSWKIDVIDHIRNKLQIDADQLMLKEEIPLHNYILREWRMR
jgi:hypothetical protein